LTPAHALGVVDVVVTNPDAQAATKGGAFTFVFPADPPPSLASAAPAQGPADGGTSVNLSGSGFIAPVSVTFGSVPATVVSVSPTLVTVLAPAQAAGTVAIQLTNADTQAATLPAAFTYTAAPVVPPPTLTGVTPASGPTAGGTTLALSGADFDAGASVTVGGLGATMVSRTATTLTVTSPPHGAGLVDVVVTNGSGKSASLPGAFTYVAPPTLSSVSPASGLTSGGTSITLAGTGFVPGPGGSQVSIGGAAATVTGGTTLTIVATTAAHPAGAQPVTVTNPDGQSATLAPGFTYVDPPPAPSAPVISGISPASGPTAGGNPVTITGANFVTNGLVTFGGVSAPIVGTVLANQITVTAPIDQPAGPVDVTFLNPFTGQVASVALGYTYVAPAPTIDGVSNRGAPPAGGITMNLVGLAIQPGCTVTFGGAPATGLVLSDATPPRKLLTLTVPPQPAGAGAFVVIVLRNPDGQTATWTGFHYGPPPVVSSVSVAAPATLANVHKGDVITITGQDFSTATGVQVSIGLNAVISSATPTQLVVVAPKNNPGVYTVVVTNTDGQTGVAPPGFTVTYPGP
ncbi:MAG TPA: IPT/TIG domain-containing protein, partial [Anaeromyxobacteraceae bacterium]|nr:IPT/TIG domain-containing protein [Anaeromyxobacteraceae bacterium]